MKALMGMLIVTASVLPCGCGKNAQDDAQSRKDTQDDKRGSTEAQDAGLSGTWQGNIVEKGRSTLVELRIQEQEGKLAGTLTVLSETGQDVGQGMSFDLVQVKRSGDRLKFVMPVGGEGDDDNVAFDLRMKGNRLEGHGHELREGSENLPITFTRKESKPDTAVPVNRTSMPPA